MSLCASLQGGEPESRADFEEAVRHVCSLLTDDIVRNGEGVKHVVKLNLQNAPSRVSRIVLGHFAPPRQFPRMLIVRRKRPNR